MTKYILPERELAAKTHKNLLLCDFCGFLRLVLFLATGLWLCAVLNVAAIAQTPDALTRTRKLVQEIQAAAYPELKDKRIELTTFRSESDYFQSRFAIGRFLTGRRMRYQIYVNPLVYERNCPDAALRAIIAHELAHVLFYRQRNRLELLGLVRLVGSGYTVKFERGADLEAVARGYGAGLKEYRLWLYGHIQPRKLVEKRRNYFSPEELDVLIAEPARLACWRKNVPRSLSEIETGPCAKEPASVPRRG